MGNDLAKDSVTEVARILRSFNQPEKWKDSPWLLSSLIKSYIQARKPQTASQALKEAFSDTLNILAQENSDYGDILRGRFWEERSVAQMVKSGRPQYWEERNFYIRQKKALARFASLLLEQEQRHRETTGAVEVKETFPQKRNLSARMFFSFIGLLALFFGFQKYLHRAPQNTLGGKALAPILIPTPIHANEQIVLQENFDSTPAINFKYKLGLWVVVPENARNNVLDINSMDTALEYPVVEFGESKWKNFSFKTRVNIVDYSASNDAPLASIKFRGKYKIAFTPYWKGIDLVLDPPWKIISGRTIEIQKNKWYRVRIEVEGSTVNVFLDDKLVISDVIADKIFGSFGFSTWPEAHVQFDDITIASTDE